MATAEEMRRLEGKRVLVYIGMSAKVVGHPTEAKILELSPSGEYVKLQKYRSDESTYVEWQRSKDVELVEVLD
ncbi:MAG: hypothetical protein ACTSUO_00780 [Candidatus Thorarchaeota archaeon]